VAIKSVLQRVVIDHTLEDGEIVFVGRCDIDGAVVADPVEIRIWRPLTYLFVIVTLPERCPDGLADGHGLLAR
jgi:hypothetical protein